jgi:L,D-peptidoglycan transpeptidase YkuD (ErfK/YbiS/YcfS/YnhG family)
MKPSFGQLTSIHKKEIIQLIKANKGKLNNVEQLVVAINDSDSSNKAIVVALERKNKRWKIKLNAVEASIGRTGFALPGEKIEGDGKSPTGVFALGQLYTYEATVNTSLPFIQTNSEDKWIDDPNHENYNTHIRGNTTAKSFEHLKLSSIDYKYCMVIEYNTHPVVKGKGSAIFFHLATPNYDPTAGCVAIQESDMDKILLWLDPNKQKAILMGNKNHLQK